MNRVGLGLAVGAGYVLGRTKKAKVAFAVGSLVAGKRMNLSPRMIADLVNQQLKNNPQVKEIGDQLRGDLRGVGKAASGALVERQIGALADRLHSRTSQMRGQLSGGEDEEEYEDEERDEASDEEPEEDESRDEEESEEPRQSQKTGGPDRSRQSRDDSGGERRAPAKKAAKSAAPAKKAAKKAPAKKTAQHAVKKAPGAGGAAKKVGSAGKAAAKTAGGDRQGKGGGEG